MPSQDFAVLMLFASNGRPAFVFKANTRDARRLGRSFGSLTPAVLVREDVSEIEADETVQGLVTAIGPDFLGVGAIPGKPTEFVHA